MTQQTSANLKCIIDDVITDVETSLDHTLLSEDRTLLHNTLTELIVSGTKKYIKGSIEHSDGVTAFSASINPINELSNETIDLIFYVAALKARRGSAQ